MSETPVISKIIETLFSDIQHQHEEIIQSERKFVHYTSSEAALKIIKSNQIWMRDTSCMNDLLEVKHGINILINAYDDTPGKEFRAALDETFPNASGAFTNVFNQVIKGLNNGTYLASFSLHNEWENGHGRLSMWRAYGKPSGVAIVLNPTVFFNKTGIIPAYTNKVSYEDNTRLARLLAEKAKAIRENITELQKVTQHELVISLANLFYFSVLASKHSAFREEEEVRVIYTPGLNRSTLITEEIENIGGISQLVQKIDLKKYHDDFDASIPALVDRIIIGPTQYPEVQRRAFIKALIDAEVPDAESKVHISNVPLRT